MQFRSLRPTRALGVNAALVVVIVAGGIWAYQTVWGGSAASAAPSTSSRRATATVADVSETVSTSATVASSNVVTANFTTSGTVTKIYVKLGQHVTKGQKLARIDATPSEQQLTTAEDNLTAANDSLSRAKDAGDTSSIDTAQAQVDSAQDAVDSAQAAVDGTVLYAPITGTIIAQNGVVGASSGSTGSSGSGGNGSGSGSSSSSSSSGGFMQIADLTKMEVDADFPEADATKLTTGQTARITWNALSGATAAGTVSSIDPTATTSNNVVTYGVVVKLTSLPAGIRIGQTTTVVVTIASKANVLSVPSTAVTTVGGLSFVNVMTNGVETRTPIQVGLVGDALTEVTSGLNEGQEVVLPAAASTSTSNNPFANLGGGFGGLGGAGGFGGGGGFTRGGAGGAGGTGGGGR